MFLLFIHCRPGAEKEMKATYTSTILTNSQIRNVTLVRNSFYMVTFYYLVHETWKDDSWNDIF